MVHPPSSSVVSAVSSCSSAFSWLADPFFFSSPSLSFWSVLVGSALQVFLLLAFGPLVWTFRSVAVPLVCSLLLVVCSCLLSRVVQWVLQGLHVLACPGIRGGFFPGLSLFCIFGLCRFGSCPSFLPSSPAPPVSFGLVIVLSPRWGPPLRVYWFSHPPMVHCGFVFCCLSPI